MDFSADSTLSLTSTFIDNPEKKLELLYKCFQVLLKEDEVLANIDASRSKRGTAEESPEQQKEKADGVPAHQKCVTPNQLVFTLQAIDPIAQTRTTQEELEAIVAGELLMDPELAASGKVSIFEASAMFQKQAYERLVSFADFCVMWDGKGVDPHCVDMLKNAIALKAETKRLMLATEKEEKASRNTIVTQEDDSWVALRSQLRRATHITALRQQLAVDVAAGKKSLEMDAFAAATKDDAKRLAEIKQEQARVKEEGKQFVQSMTALEEQAQAVTDDIHRYHQQIQILGKWKDTALSLVTSEAETQWNDFLKSVAQRYAETDAQLDRLEDKIINCGRGLMMKSLEAGHEKHKVNLAAWAKMHRHRSEYATSPKVSSSPQQTSDGAMDLSWLTVGVGADNPDNEGFSVDRTVNSISKAERSTGGGRSPQPLGGSFSESRAGATLGTSVISTTGGAAGGGGVVASDPWLSAPDPLADPSNLTIDADAAELAQAEYALSSLKDATEKYFDQTVSSQGNPVMTFEVFTQFVHAFAIDVPGSLAITFFDEAKEDVMVEKGDDDADHTLGGLSPVGMVEQDDSLVMPVGDGHGSATSPSRKLSMANSPLPADRNLMKPVRTPEKRNAAKSNKVKGLTLLGLANILLAVAKVRYGSVAVSNAFLLARFVESSILPFVHR